MDGLLVVDKPAGPTSHDVVARMRRVLGERRIGHTGTLDPAATGVLPLVLGRATRLARFMSAADKSYRATIRLGVSTDTADAEGRSIGVPYQGAMPSPDRVEAALDAFRGSFVQQPPAFSAKRIGGRRSYELARARAAGGHQTGTPSESSDGRTVSATLPAPVTVNVDALHFVAMEGDTVVLEMRCSAGFYVRALAHDLGETLGIGAHLVALRRTRSGDVGLDGAIRLDEAEHDPASAAAAVIPLARLLPGLPSVVLTEEGVRHAINGRELRAPATLEGCARLLSPTGDLVGIAVPGEAPGSLHPAVVLM